MSVRRTIAALAAALLVAAVVAGWYVARDHGASVSAVSSRAGPGGATGSAAGPQDFALPEVAVSELARDFPPFVFVVKVTPPGGAPATEILEPAASGRALLPPVEPGSELAVSVVAGGARYGFAWEETVGAGAARAPAQGGRFYVVVPVRIPSAPSGPPRLFVVDGDEWPIAGAHAADAGRTWSATTSEAGCCSAGTAAERIRVEPPPERPDLGTFEGGAGRWDFVARVGLSGSATGDVQLPPATDATAPADFAEVELRPSDGRPFLRRVGVPPSRVLTGLPLGTYSARWCAGGVWREATLEVAALASRFVPSAATERATRVEVPGTWQGYGAGPAAMLLLLERSRTACVLPRSILESGNYEMTNGRGYTSRSFVADVQGDGTAVFEGVAPGDYEIVSSADPFAVSRCVRIDGRGDVARIGCTPRLRAAQIVGRVDGPSGARYDVQVRGLGRFYDVSRSLKCPGDYEFADLAEGLYSVRAIAADAFRGRRARDDSGITPWRNVVVEPGGRVTVDFKVD
jgi:hypothetical protein